jgi:8-oxo-dGTP pyrophosphatase MutT (NUDIX family)
VSEDVPLREAATVILVRDNGGDGGVEVLLLRRNTSLAFHGGSWVFPGGRVDAEDHDAAGGVDERAARLAAVREAREEAGIVLDGASLVPFSHWTTPPGPPRRFATWFFIGSVEDAVVTTDGGEITDHRWFEPSAALAAQRAGEIELPPPTFVSLLRLEGVPSAAHALREARASAYLRFEPRLHPVAGGFVSLYDGDVAYGDRSRFEETGPRHRLWAVESGWRYERS